MQERSGISFLSSFLRRNGVFGNFILIWVRTHFLVCPPSSVNLTSGSLGNVQCTRGWTGGQRDHVQFEAWRCDCMKDSSRQDSHLQGSVSKDLAPAAHISARRYQSSPVTLHTGEKETPKTHDITQVGYVIVQCNSKNSKEKSICSGEN